MPTAVAAGAFAFVQFACAQCHGIGGKGGVSPDVPALTSVGKQLTVAQLTRIINHGLGESANPKRPYMPVWGAVISAPQVGEVVSYIRAGLPQVPGATPVSVPEKMEQQSLGRRSMSATAASTATGRTGSAGCRTTRRLTR